jgi:LytS/YehU family sensor histidine kinase
MLDQSRSCSGAIDAIRIERERQEQECERRRSADCVRGAGHRAQINPHFLFNALTTIGYLIDAAPDRALRRCSV